MVTTITAPEITPWVADFLDSRRGMPWPGVIGPEDFQTRARALYDLYAQQARADSRVVLPERDFGLLMETQGLSRSRDMIGHVYNDITLETRVERAKAAVLAHFATPVYIARARARENEHMAAVRHVQVERFLNTDVGRWAEPYWDEREVPVPCDHVVHTPEDAEADAEAVEAWLTENRAEVEAWYERRFGPFLRWKPGDRDPLPEWNWLRDVERARALVADKEREYAEVDSRAAAVRAEVHAASERRSELEGRSPFVPPDITGMGPVEAMTAILSASHRHSLRGVLTEEEWEEYEHLLDVCNLNSEYWRRRSGLVLSGNFQLSRASDDESRLRALERELAEARTNLASVEARKPAT